MYLNFTSRYKNILGKVEQVNPLKYGITSNHINGDVTYLITQYFDTPFVVEVPIKVAMQLEQKIDISINNTILVIGSIQQIYVDESIISKDRFVSLDKANYLLVPV